MNLLRLHELATAFGDGLHPDLVRLFEECARIETDPQVVRLAGPGVREQAGPVPAGRAGLFVPGNVLRVVGREAVAKRPASRQNLKGTR
ncbi:MAG: hypothetical protein KF694_12290 [Mesorhizobium sp.]|nr:hypothetical protein [Mesorhizobium sp.]